MYKAIIFTVLIGLSRSICADDDQPASPPGDMAIVEADIALHDFTCDRDCRYDVTVNEVLQGRHDLSDTPINMPLPDTGDGLPLGRCTLHLKSYGSGLFRHWESAPGFIPRCPSHRLSRASMALGTMEACTHLFAFSTLLQANCLVDDNLQLHQISKATKSVIPQTPEGCNAAKGYWGEDPPGPQMACHLQTHDALKICTDDTQCEGSCLVAMNIPMGHRAIGSCSTTVPIDGGCYKFMHHHVVRMVCTH